MSVQQAPVPDARDRPALPGWLRVPYTVLAGTAVAVYAGFPGTLPYWFADVALLASALALWYRQRLLASMMALAVLVPALAAYGGLVALLLGGVDPFGLARSLFPTEAPLPLRLASLAAAVLPLVLAWLVYRLGYDPRALRAQTLLGAAVLILGAMLAPVLDGARGGSLELAAALREAWLPAWLWIAVLALLYPVVVYLPAHLLLQELCGPPGRRLHRRLRHRSRPTIAVPPPGGRGRARAPGPVLQARLRDLVDFALARRRR